jgi:hypothetical protein
MTETINSETIENRLSKFDSQLLAHPELRSAYEAVLGLVQRPAVPIIEVVGPTGVGKSTLLKKLFGELLKQHRDAMNRNPGLIPVILAEVPSPDSGTFNWADFYKRLLERLFEPMVNEKSLGGSHEPTAGQKPGTVIQLRWAVEQTIRNRGTKVVILDEGQHLTKVANARRLQDQMDAVKSISSLAGVQFVMVGTYELLTLLNRNGQLARRTRCIHFRRYDFEKPAHREAFTNLVGMFEARLPIKTEGLLTQNLEFVYEHCLGCIGILKDWLKLASNNAVDDNRESLTIRDLQATALPNDSLLQILQEILEGERSIESVTRRDDELRTKLGLKTMQDAAVTNTTKPPSARRSVGERNPIRDSVGV